MTDDVIENGAFMHYASKYYDPQKAREYYLRNRELKGKRPSSDLKSPDQKIGWNYAQKQITDARKAEVDKQQKDYAEKTKSGSEAQAKRLEALQLKAKEAVARIQDKLKAFAEEKVDLLPIPDNASPKLRAYLEKQNRGRLASKREAVAKESAKAKAERQVIVENVRGEITKAREAYAAARTQQAADYKKQREEGQQQYEQTLDAEYNNIKTKVR